MRHCLHFIRELRLKNKLLPTQESFSLSIHSRFYVKTFCTLNISRWSWVHCFVSVVIISVDYFSSIRTRLSPNWTPWRHVFFKDVFLKNSRDWLTSHIFFFGLITGFLATIVLLFPFFDSKFNLGGEPAVTFPCLFEAQSSNSLWAICLWRTHCCILETLQLS